MKTSHEEPSTGPATTTRARHIGRDQLINRVFELKPALERHLRVPLPDELRGELQSVTLHQLEVLGMLKHGGMRMRDLARELDVSEPAATAVADRLVRNGLVERRSDPADRRTVRLELSDHAASVLGRFEAARREALASAFEVVSDQQLRSLIDVLETLASAPSPRSQKRGEGAA